MNTMSPVPKDDPLMIAWEAYTATADYRNTYGWAAHREHIKGSLWAAFCAGRKSLEAELASHEASQEPKP